MKKIFSLLLAVLMLVSALPVAYAAETADYTVGTQVVYTAANAESYSITVPASLTPGASGTVTLSGSWASNQTVKVTADKTVTLTNSINAVDQKTLDVSFAGMEYAGDNTQARTYTEPVSVAAMPSDALFGSWDGKFNYNVEMTESEPEDDGMRTIALNGNGDSYYCNVNINGTTYYSPTTLEVPEGTVISLYVNFYDRYEGSDATITVNNDVVYDKGGYGNESGTNPYAYTVNADVSIYLETSGRAGQISLVEAEPEVETATLTIGDYATSHFSVSVDGVSQNDTTLTVPVGTVVEISALDLKCDKGCSAGSAYVYLNDSEVSSGAESLTYSYTVTGDAAISFSANPDLCRDCNNYAIAANVYITEG